MRRLPLFLLALSSLLPLDLAALDVRFHPGEVVYPYEVEPNRGLSTVVLQNIALVQREGAPVTLESLEIQVRSGGQTVQTQTVPAAALDQAAQQLAAMDAAGVLKLYDFHFQTSRSLGEGVKVAPGRTLAPGTGTLVLGRALLLSGEADEIVVVAHAKDGAGKPVEARGSIRVAGHRSPNQFHFPLAGTIYVGAAPSLHSHHRWAVPQEFALDLLVLGADGKTFKGTGARLDDYYAFGRDVLAVADGVVVEAVADGDESNDRLRQTGESMEAFMQRTVAEQNKLLARGPKATIGNYVVLRHEGGEHSQYAHLKQGSVRVRAGDTVKRGQVIGQLGQSGNSTEPHLHFQLTDGPDVLYSRGLPIVFQNVEVLDVTEPRPLQSGWIVTVKE
jgi:murein DD-endopeptidase MepM/ murein hydrolase activator NlpD